jgi:hypothetical protein
VSDRIQNTTSTMYNNRYDDYELMYDPDVAAAERSSIDAKAARPKPKKKEDKRVIAELSNEADGRDGVFQTTYQPARFEAVWLRD